MRALSFLVLALLCRAAVAQAPVEERRSQNDTLAGAQQRVEFSRRAAEQADQRAGQAEQEARDAQAALESAQKRHEEAKARAETATRELTQARANASTSRHAYEQESAQFDRVRRGAARPQGPGKRQEGKE